MESSDKIAIYIPAYNAASTIPKVLERISARLKSTAAEIFIIDNASKDYTHLVAIGYQHLEGLHNLEIIRNPENYGYGGSQKIAYKRCIDRNYKYVAMLHGDAQYAPEYLDGLLDRLKSEKADMIFGSRMLGKPLAGGMPLIRFIGNRFLTWVQNRLLNTHLSEFHSGYRVFSVETLKKVPFEKLSSNYHFDTEIIVLFVNAGCKVIEAPIPTHYGDEKNYVNIWRYGTDVLLTTVTYFLHKKGWRKSKNWSKIFNQ